MRRSSLRVPEPLAVIAELMSTFQPAWALCGGWAVDAWLGRRTRDHVDIDIAVFLDLQRAIFDHLAGWELIAHDARVPDDTAELWDGRRLDLPAHIHARARNARRGLPNHLQDPAKAGFSLDIQLGERSGSDWILRHEPRIALPVTDCIRPSGWGLPAVVPEVILFYKAEEPRPHDETDFLALLPTLADRQRGWLRETIAKVHPGHRWPARLSS